jgi:hypothetical protein
MESTYYEESVSKGGGAHQGSGSIPSLQRYHLETIRTVISCIRSHSGVFTIEQAASHLCASEDKRWEVEMVIDYLIVDGTLALNTDQRIVLVRDGSYFYE